MSWKHFGIKLRLNFATMSTSVRSASPFLKGSVWAQALLLLDAVKHKPSRLHDGNKIART